MAERTARVKLMLNSGDFLGGMQRVTQQVQSAGRAMGSALSGPMMSGLSAAKKSMQSTIGGVGTALKFGVALGGAWELKDAAKGALTLQGTYRNLAFAIKAGTGESVKFEAIQKTVQGIGMRWSRTNDEVASTYKHLWDEVGNTQFAEKATEAVSMVATATGASTDTLTNLAGQLGEKFGIAGGDIAGALSKIYAFSNQGGLGIDEMGDRLGMLGASAKQLGIVGTEGMGKMIAFANLGEKASGTIRKAIVGVTGLMDEMASPGKVKEIEKKLGLKLTTKDGKIKGDAIDQIIKKTHGDETNIGKVFTGGSQKLMTEIGRSYKDAFESTKGTKKQKEAAGVEAFNAAMKKASTVAFDEADMTAQAAKKNDTAKAMMTRALNEMQNAFSQPEVIDAMKAMAKITPSVASGMAKLLTFAMDHPLLAGAGFLGGRAAFSGAKTFTVAIAQNSVRAAGTSMASSFVAAAAANGGGWAGAGRLIGGGLLALGVGYLIGQQIAKAMLDKDESEKVSGEVTAAQGMALAGGTDKRAQREALDKLQGERDRLQILKEDGGSFTDKMFGGMVAIGEKTGIISKEDYAATTSRTESDLAYANEAIRALRESLERGADGGDRATRQLEKMGSAAEKASRAFERMKPPGGSNGLPPPARGAPGYSGEW
jgi:hypothetical protein